MKKTIAAALLLFASPAASQQPAPLAAEMAKHAHAVTWIGQDLGGPGAVLLDRELASTQFFLIGEDHGFAEIPRIASALSKRAWKYGYRHFAMEIGPLAVEQLNAQARNDPFAAAAASNVKYPWGLPFLSWEEEARFYADVMALAGGRADAVWGLDQEFMLAPTPHLERLVALAKTDAARAAAQSLLERSRTGEKNMLEQHNPGALLFVTAKAEDFAALRTAFGNDGGEPRRIIDALEESWSIYQKNFTGDGYGNNAQRVELMKRNFRAAYNRAVANGEPFPKVFFKFGASHMQRGRNVTDTYDLGSLLPELAAMNGTRSFQLLIMPGGGTQNQYRPFMKTDETRTAPYKPDYAGVDLAVVTSAAAGEGWTLFDLRPMRRSLRKIGGVPPAVNDVLWSYDAILVIPKATAAKNLP
jgi:hypothetical protein